MSFDPLTAVFDLGSKLIDKLIPDPGAKIAAQQALLELQQKGDLAQLAAETQIMQGQLDVNKVEAANTNLFVSGARPAVIWICAAILAYQFMLYPFMCFIALLFHYSGPPFPVLDHDAITYGLLPALLGVAGMRSYDKRAAGPK